MRPSHDLPSAPPNVMPAPCHAFCDGRNVTQCVPWPYSDAIYRGQSGVQHGQCPPAYVRLHLKDLRARLAKEGSLATSISLICHKSFKEGENLLKDDALGPNSSETLTILTHVGLF